MQGMLILESWLLGLCSQDYNLLEGNICGDIVNYQSRVHRAHKTGRRDFMVKGDDRELTIVQDYVIIYSDN